MQDKQKVVVVYGAGASYNSGYEVIIKGESFKPPMDCKFFISDAVVEKLKPGMRIRKELFSAAGLNGDKIVDAYKAFGYLIPTGHDDNDHVNIKKVQKVNQLLGDDFKAALPEYGHSEFKKIEDILKVKDVCGLFQREGGEWRHYYPYYALEYFKERKGKDKNNVGYYPRAKSLEGFWSELDLNKRDCKSYDWNKENCYYKKKLETHGQIRKKYEKDYSLLEACENNLYECIYDIYANFKLKSGEEDRYKRMHEIITKHENVNLLGYITFNYDCFLEESLSEFVGRDGIRYVKGEEPLNPGQGKVILKVHGSLNWKNIPRENSIEFGSLPFVKNEQIRFDFDTDRDRAPRPAIVPPTAVKEETSGGGDKNLSNTVLNQLKNARMLLSLADKVIFVGYSLPPSDFHAKRLLRLGYCLNQGEERQGKQRVFAVLGPDEDGEHKRFCEKINDIYCYLGIITKNQIKDHFNLDSENTTKKWDIITKKLIENSWADLINDREVCLHPNWEISKDAMSKVFGEDFKKIFPILQQAHLKFDESMIEKGFYEVVKNPDKLLRFLSS